MAVRKILHMGNPLLRQVAEPVAEFNTPDLDALIEGMLDTMRAFEGAGLAAPQIGESKRVVVFGFEHNPRYPDAEIVPMTVLINPVIQPLSDAMEEDWEGCLSIPGLRGLVPRFRRIRYSGFDAKGQRFMLEVSGFHARVVQHECDHLDGILYPQRIRDMTQFGFEAELFPKDG
jgi:peptide deformylase